MMRRISSFLLMLSLSISIVGCGNASASSENANSNNDSTPSAENSPALSQGVSNTTASDDSVSSETTIETTDVISEPEPEQGFTGSLYTLPVGAKGEEWTEAQIDEYVRDCKALQNNYKPSEKGGAEIDLDAFMADFGFEYVDSFEQEPYLPYNVYWRESSGVKMAAQFDNANHLNIYIDLGSDSAGVMIWDFSNRDQNVKFYSSHFSDKGHFNKMSKLCLISYAAVLKTLTESNTFDCGRLPFPNSYSLRYTNGKSFNLQKKLDFYNVDFEPELEEVYSE